MYRLGMMVPTFGPVCVAGQRNPITLQKRKLLYIRYMHSENLK